MCSVECSLVRQSCDGPGVAGSILILLSSLQYRTLLDAVRVVVVGVAGGVSSIQRVRFWEMEG